MDNLKFLSIKQVCEKTSLSRNMIYKYRASNNFPDAIEISEGRIAFLESEIDAWMQERVLARGAA